MKHAKKLLAAALCTAGSAAPAVVADAASAAPRCNSGNAVCLYDGRNYKGKVVAVPCSRFGKGGTIVLRNAPYRFAERTESLVNGCPFNVYLGDEAAINSGNHHVRTVFRKTWRPDLGGVRFNNRTWLMSRIRSQA